MGINGEKLYDKVEWVPYVYVPAGEIFNNTDCVKTIDGKAVIRKNFRSYRDYYQFCKDREGIYENRVRPEIQFLAERYHQIPDDELEVPKLLIYTLDIEIAISEGFPHPDKAEDPIVLISIKDSQNKKTVTFGLKEYTGESGIYYRQCNTEKELLDRFLNFMYKRSPDVITGWNVWGFDLPYIINRTKRLFGEKSGVYNRLSPVRVVNMWKSKGFDDLNIDIAGVHIIDYMDAYKWYAPVKLESYSLDFVSNHELEKGKLDYSQYKDYKELMEKNWNLFVDYNVIDVKRVDELEDKLGYIKLIQALSLLTKCPMKNYQAMTSLIEGALITHYRRHRMCAPYFTGGHQKTFPAAHVKEPQAGMHEWVIDIDITSSYPSHIITLNMSNETYFGRIVAMPEHQVVDAVRKKQFPQFHMSIDGQVTDFDNDKLAKFNLALQKGLLAIAPCGSIFKTNKLGVIADVEKRIFLKRRDVKAKMKDLKNEALIAEGDEKAQLNDRATELFALQWAIKILLNAMFGITAVPYSRYFNVNIAEAITSCGRHTIKQGEAFVNELLNNPETFEPMIKFLKKKKFRMEYKYAK